MVSDKKIFMGISHRVLCSKFINNPVIYVKKLIGNSHKTILSGTSSPIRTKL
jgi:hypothetical protein